MKLADVRIAAFTLAFFVPTVLACSVTPGTEDEEVSEGSDMLSAAAPVEVSITGPAGEKTRTTLARDRLLEVLQNRNDLFADGFGTRDYASVFKARRFEVPTLPGKKMAIVRNGNFLSVEGAKKKVAVEIAAAESTLRLGGDAAGWTITLSGPGSAAQKQAILGAVATGVLVGLEDGEVLAAAEEGRCEVVCIVTIGIVVGVGILSALAAYIVCETAGQEYCRQTAAAMQKCPRGKSRSAKKICGPILEGSGTKKNGKMLYNGGCEISLCQ